MSEEGLRALIVELLGDLLDAAKQDVKDAKQEYREHEEGRVAGIRQCIHIVKKL